MNNNIENAKTTMSEEAIKEKYLRPTKTKLQLAKLASALMIIAALLLSRYVFKAPLKIEVLHTVYDEANQLSQEAFDKIEQRGNAIYEQSGKKAKIVLVVSDEQKNYRGLKNQAEELFSAYKLSDDSLLLVLSLHEYSGGVVDSIVGVFDDLVGGGRQPFAYHKGKNLNKLLDSDIDAIISENFLNSSYYGEKNYSDAVLGAYSALADKFDEHYNIDSKNGSAENNGEPESTEESGGKRVFQVAFGTAAIFLILFLCFGILTGKKKDPVPIYKKPFWFSIIG